MRPKMISDYVAAEMRRVFLIATKLRKKNAYQVNEILRRSKGNLVSWFAEPSQARFVEVIELQGLERSEKGQAGAVLQPAYGVGEVRNKPNYEAVLAAWRAQGGADDSKLTPREFLMLHRYKTQDHALLLESDSAPPIVKLILARLASEELLKAVGRDLPETAALDGELPEAGSQEESELIERWLAAQQSEPEQP